jgi:hypothetical protein
MASESFLMCGPDGCGAGLPRASETDEKRNQARKGVNGMDVQAHPVSIGGVMVEGGEGFADHVRSRQIPKAQVLKRLKQRLAAYEQQYGMSAEAFYRRIGGTGKRKRFGIGRLLKRVPYSTVNRSTRPDRMPVYLLHKAEDP